jgi:hypothetical protein
MAFPGSVERPWPFQWPSNPDGLSRARRRPGPRALCRHVTRASGGAALKAYQILLIGASGWPPADAPRPRGCEAAQPCPKAAQIEESAAGLGPVAWPVGPGLLSASRLCRAIGPRRPQHPPTPRSGNVRAGGRRGRRRTTITSPGRAPRGVAAVPPGNPDRRCAGAGTARRATAAELAVV